VGVRFPKPPIRSRATRRRAAERRDARQSERVRERSGGRCEVVTDRRCTRPAQEIHHLRKPRLVHPEPEAKQHVCTQCHLWITGPIGGRVLQIISDGAATWSDKYERLR
jgi:hypothetical protein